MAKGVALAEPRARPTYDDAVVQTILDRMGLGHTLKAICRDPGMPPASTVRHWVIDDVAGLAVRYRRAREAQAEVWADEIIETAEDSSLEPNDRRVKIDAKKWIMSKIAPRQYGDKIIHSGDADNPIRVLHAAVGLNQLSTGELDALEQFASARLGAIDVEHETIEDKTG